MNEKVYTVVYMAIVAAVFTAAVSAVSLVSQERRDLNQQLARNRVVMRVLGIETTPEATLQELQQLYEQRVERTDMAYSDPRTGDEFAILAGYGPDGELLGYAFEVGGQGFWDVIRGYMAVSPALDRVIGLSFFMQSETPGLGAEITKPWFEQQFEGLELPPDFAEDEEAEIGLAVAGAEPGPYDVDAITGATQTSKRLEAFMNADLRAALRALQEGQ